MPLIGEAQAHQLVNRPEAFTPDGMCVMGECPEVRYTDGGDLGIDIRHVCNMTMCLHYGLILSDMCAKLAQCHTIINGYTSHVYHVMVVI